mgnify:CR=1 FL=1
MTEWITVASLVGFGLLLLILEFIFIPGTTVIGLAGLASCGFGVYLSYDYFGGDVGTLVFTGTGVAALLAFYISLRSGLWKNFALHSILSGRVNDELEPLIIGDKGKAISNLRPVGKAEFKDQIREVYTLGKYVNSGETVQIIRVNRNRIYVEPIETANETSLGLLNGV